MNNPIINEVRETRAAFAAEHGHDLQRIQEWAKAAHEARKQAGGKSKAKTEELSRVIKGEREAAKKP